MNVACFDCCYTKFHIVIWQNIVIVVKQIVAFYAGKRILAILICCMEIVKRNSSKINCSEVFDILKIKG